MEDKYKGKEVILETDQVNPFGNWCDWYGTNGEAVVTFSTIEYELGNVWEQQCVDYDHAVCDHEGDKFPGFVKVENEDFFRYPYDCHPKRVVDHSQLDVSEIRTPGIYVDGTHYDEEEFVDEAYTIIVPFRSLSEKLCDRWIEKLNKKYDRNFKLNRKLLGPVV